MDCSTPFLIAATSLESPTGEEYFSVTSISDFDVIQGFLRGPYPPHNKPRVLSLEQAIGRSVDEFMAELKEVELFRKTVKFISDGASLVTMTQGLAISSNSGKLCVYADDSTPMALRVSWERIEGENRRGSE